MPTHELVELTVEERNLAFIDVESKIDEQIQKVKPERKSMWRDMFERRPYGLFEGLSKKTFRFFAGRGSQRGLHRWHGIQLSREPSAGDSGYDSARLNPYQVNYGVKSMTYGGFGIEYVTPHINIKDLKYTFQLAQQLEAIFGFLPDVTSDEWENYGREMYAKFCYDAGNQFVLSDGNVISSSPVRFSYDPFSVDSDGDNVITLDSGTNIGILNWDYLLPVIDMLEIQAPMAASGLSGDGKPMFPLIMDVRAFHRMVKEDPDIREDFRQGRPNVNIEGFGSVSEYQGYGLTHDTYIPRFRIKSDDGTTLTLKRIDAQVESNAATFGTRWDVNPEYLEAEFEVFYVFLKDVFSIEVPPTLDNPGGGTSFGPSPGLNGVWSWVNNKDNDANPHGWLGYYMMMIEAFAKQGRYEEEPIMVLCRRFTHVVAKDTEVGGTAAASEQDVAVAAVAGDIDSDNNTVTLTLEGFLTAEAGQAVTLTADVDGDADTYDGIIAEHSQAPTYVLALEDVTGLVAGDLTAGDAKVTVV